ncbi:hypothetical protein [Bacillus cereus group sp. BfR-BA-01383]|uniref:hypothetical protein n=1 Tax=Bacillus cereus group sp. BfR-BA-01383 TaxID=2920327 RepID=UPI001F58C261|nr:hypothetical protein [Bacillus cereus group sp. BfR-BA-01383]
MVGDNEHVILNKELVILSSNVKNDMDDECNKECREIVRDLLEQRGWENGT